MFPAVASPLLLGAAEMAGNTALALALSKYLSGDIDTKPSSPPTSFSPGKKSLTLKKHPKQVKKEALGTMGEGIVAGLGVVAGLVGVAANSMSSNATTLSADNKAEADAKKLLHADAPLLFNQVAMQNSLNGVTDAINSNTIVSAKLFGTLHANLSAISSTLIAISATLLEISDNYSGELEKADDLPYVDSETFYELLRKSGATFHQVQTWQSEENSLVERLSKSGASYSEIKQAVLEFRKSNIPSSTLLKANNSVAGITQPSPVSHDGKPQSPVTDHVSEWAKSAKQLADFKITPLDIQDLDGNPLATMSPAQAQAVHHATNARHKTDTNNEEFDDSMFPSLSMPVLPFIGSSDIFNPQHSTPNTNPFTHKNL